MDGTLHYWQPTGSGEASRNIVSPLCNPNVRRHINSFGRDRTEAVDTCPVCWDLHPVGLNPMRTTPSGN